ncbi:unnamed protein product [Rotaria sp. Silwood2]|nr:unnamed protein product [Rotaria sp. Silwood2]CAF2609537.1 unnamed protein product [Rotaria sp. Silwood2]CAF2850781.1 unnamed protein product [Rotaria sp. Silwood2]CAF3023295.1 unnamed protein product [Rotaria sp. Silwood2]CAF3899552.1 unnamed protein product [Rotaria sp. Silwood2]
MYVSSMSILFFAVIILISASAVPFSPLYQINDDQMSRNTGDAQMQYFLKRSVKLDLWPYKRNSPLCDYRLQFRPLGLTPTLCAYRNSHKEEDPNSINPFKYG